MAKKNLILKKAVAEPVTRGDMIQNPIFEDHPKFKSWERVAEITMNSLDGLFVMKTIALEKGNSINDNVYIRTYNISEEREGELTGSWCDSNCYSNEIFSSMRDQYEDFVDFVTAGLQGLD